MHGYDHAVPPGQNAFFPAEASIKLALMGFQPWEPTTERQIERTNKAEGGSNGSMSQWCALILAQR